MAEYPKPDRSLDTLPDPLPEAFVDAENDLRDIAERVDDDLESAHLGLRMSRGLLTAAGLQYNVRLHREEPEYETIFFRAYIPLDGYPIQLDFLSENDELRAANNREELVDLVYAYVNSIQAAGVLRSFAEMRA